MKKFVTVIMLAVMLVSTFAMFNTAYAQNITDFAWYDEELNFGYDPELWNAKSDEYGVWYTLVDTYDELLNYRDGVDNFEFYKHGIENGETVIVDLTMEEVEAIVAPYAAYTAEEES